ncbi:MAG: thiol-disulfide oxidoreductase DCC family protein [Bacteroidota bacterium]
MSRRLPILIPKDKKVLLYDGVCNLCDGFVQFVLKRDKKPVFYFASLQSDIGQQLLEKHGVDARDLSTVVLIDGQKVYTHSDVALQIFEELGGVYRLLYPFKFLPKGFRNNIYNWVAANRYRFFGKKEVCMLPQPEWHSRFLDVL